MLQIGIQAPMFSARDQHGRELTLSGLLARGPLVLYFYPKDFTPGCTREACHFRDAYEELKELGAEVVGASMDDEESHQRFSTANRLPFSLIADGDKSLHKMYDALGILGMMAKRTTYVIDRAGVIRGVFRHELSMEAHVKDVRAALTAL